MQLTRPYAAPALRFFAPSRAVQLEGFAGGDVGVGNLGFWDAIANAVGSAVSSVANAVSAGAVAGEQTKQQQEATKQIQAQVQAQIEAARLQAEASARRAQAFADALPWVGVGIAGLGLLFILARK
jgi:ElaB/YqjD/DUF883 family membrane-anchored ribosome-binding protein